ncbi:vitamin B12 transporter BtuB [mine drainage metagenome]|uniref:Vitamin B12 transporter BtuB n=1 Tax=mine drainage metagenome TaxID=410659 RepID=A0A1J5SID8_9ZZZZ
MNQPLRCVVPQPGTLKTRSKSPLRGAALALAVLLGAAGAAAQQVPTDTSTKKPDAAKVAKTSQTSDQQAASSDQVVLDAFVVTGIRASVSSALDIKRSDPNMVDAIVAEDIGKFPDNNVVEAMQRLPGIQVTDRGSGQIATVTIRGLPDVSTTINGRNVFTASGQAYSLQDVPASLLASVEVYKTRSANLLENGIAGQIDIRTHRPFDFKGDEFSFAARGIYQSLSKDIGPNLSALYSKRWETGAGKFGALVNVSYSETPYRNNVVTPGAEVPFMTANPPAGWVPYQRIFTDGSNPWVAGLTDGLPSAPGSTMMINGVATPYVLSRDAIFATDTVGSTKRPAVNLSLQWAPNKDSEYTLEAFYDGYRNKNFNNLLFSFVDWWGGPLGPVTLYPGTNIVQSRQSVGYVYGFNSGDMSTGKTDSFITALSGKWNINPDFQLKADLSWQTSVFNSTFFAVRIDRVAPSISVNFNAHDGLPAFSFPGSDLNDPSLWNIAQMYDQAHRNKGSAGTFTSDGVYKLHIPFFKDLKFGVRYDDRSASEAQRLQGGNTSLGQSLAKYPQLQYHNSNFFDGRAAIPSSWVVANGYYIYNHADEIRNLYKSTVDPTIQTSDQLQLTENFHVNEVNTAGYFMTDFETYLAGHKLDGQAGARYVYVKTDMTFGGNSGSATVGKLLPSASLRYNITPNLRFRLAYGETLRRPNFTDLNPTITYTKDVTNIGYGTASGGNSNLRPTKSKNYDMALEYYLNDASAVYVSVFERQIDGLVVPFRRKVVYQGYDYILSQPDNTSNGKLDGYEIGSSFFPKDLPGVLNGLGVMASFTALHSSQDIPITDPNTGAVIGTQQTPFFLVSNRSYNATLAYERPKFSFRLSYEWRSSFLHHNEAAQFANPLGVYDRPEQAMDAQFSYNLRKNLVLTVDATNLTNEIYQSYYGNKPGDSTTNNFTNTLLSRTIAVGVRYTY